MNHREPSAAEAEPQPWLAHGWVAHSRLLLDSYRRLCGRELVARSVDPIEDARQLFLAPRVVVSHGTQADPLLNYANRCALDLWQIDIPTLLMTPSRLTAEPMHRDERARLLERTARDGYVDDYQGIRITQTGRRFRIEQATVWNLIDSQGSLQGQAATFDHWVWLDGEHS
jgi:hypothetical protein